MIVVCAALKGGVGKTTTSVYLTALAAETGRPVTLVDADPQASAAEWVEEATDDVLGKVEVVEAPTERLLGKALDRLAPDTVAVVDMRPGDETALTKSFGRADVVVVPTRVGGVETPSATAVVDLVPDGVPFGVVICAARTFTRDFHEALAHLGGRGGGRVGHDPRAGVDRRRARRLAVARRSRRLRRRVAPRAARRRPLTRPPAAPRI